MPAAIPVKVGVVGCGSVSVQYFSQARRFPILDIAACCDLDMNLAAARSRDFAIARPCTLEQLLADPQIEIVLNLTNPSAHVPVTLAALAAGKHVYSEKPLATTRQQGLDIVRLADARSLRVGCAPDTILGSGVQTARSVLDSGAIGRPVAFTACMMTPGHERWHPNPDYYYQPGGGPMMDMGPYYLAALLHLLGPVRQITGAATFAIPRRTITSQPKSGQRIEVRTPDHICGTMLFDSGVLGSIVMSFASAFGDYDAQFPITIFGTDGAMRAPDPNQFTNPVKIRRLKDSGDSWTTIDPVFPHDLGRSIGLADMATAIRAGSPFRCDAHRAMNVLDLMVGFLDSAHTGQVHIPPEPYQPMQPMNGDEIAVMLGK
jgi:predicted dehydrogenase